jgi:hypothetical protein
VKDSPNLDLLRAMAVGFVVYAGRSHYWALRKGYHVMLGSHRRRDVLRAHHARA